MEIISTELALKDLETCNHRLDSVNSIIKKGKVGVKEA